MSGLRVALPAGALFSDACDLLSSATGHVLSPSLLDRTLLTELGGNRYVKVRPIDVPVYVEMGACDCGITGKDILWETPRDIYELIDLGFGRCRLVLAAPEGSAMRRGEWPRRLRIGTKYPVATRRFFDAKGISAELLKLHGSVELGPAAGLVDAVVDLTMTGRTLAANNLVELEEVGISTARFVVNHASLKTRFDAVNSLATALRGAVAAPAITVAR